MKTTIKILRPEEVWQPKLGAPRGNRNALRTGRYVAEKQALRRYIHSFMRRACALAREVEAEMKARERAARSGGKRTD